MTKFHWSMPLRPAFCHIMALMAESASQSVSANHSAPSCHRTRRCSTRKLAHTIRTLCDIQPVRYSSRI